MDLTEHGLWLGTFSPGQQGIHFIMKRSDVLQVLTFGLPGHWTADTFLQKTQHRRSVQSGFAHLNSGYNLGLSAYTEAGAKVSYIDFSECYCGMIYTDVFGCLRLKYIYIYIA